MEKNSVYGEFDNLLAMVEVTLEDYMDLVDMADINKGHGGRIYYKGQPIHPEPSLKAGHCVLGNTTDKDSELGVIVDLNPVTNTIVFTGVTTYKGRLGSMATTSTIFDLTEDLEEQFAHAIDLLARLVEQLSDPILDLLDGEDNGESEEITAEYNDDGMTLADITSIVDNPVGATSEPKEPVEQSTEEEPKEPKVTIGELYRVGTRLIRVSGVYNGYGVRSEYLYLTGQVLDLEDNEYHPNDLVILGYDIPHTPTDEQEERFSAYEMFAETLTGDIRTIKLTD